MNWKSLLFSSHGRINRGKYWLASLLLIVVWIAFFIVALVTLGNRVDDLLRFAGVGILLWLGGAILFGATMWSGIAVGVKRLHDRDRSGWWVVLLWFGPSAIGGLQATTMNAGLTMFYNLASLAIVIWGFVELGCLRGTSGANAYGPDPLGGFSREPLR